MKGTRSRFAGLRVAVVAAAVTTVSLPVAALTAFSAAGPRPVVIPLEYDQHLIAIGFPSPLLRVTIGGRSAWFIIDTGAGVHTFATWYVRAAGLQTHETKATVTGSTGAEQRARAIKSVRGRMRDGRALTVDEAVVVDLPPIFESSEIGGLLSPQLLPKRGAVVLDLTAPSMSFVPFALAVKQVRDLSAEAKVCRNADSQFKNRLYAVPSTVAGASAMLLIDTGATRTVLASRSDAATKLANRTVAGGQTQGVGGAMADSPRVPHLRLIAPGLTTTVDVSIGAAAGGCGPDGLIGMDVLRRCVVVLGESGFGWSCRADQ